MVAYGVGSWVRESVFCDLAAGMYVLIFNRKIGPLFLRLEGESDTIVAVPKACGFRSVAKPVPLVATALSAVVFGAGQQKFEVELGLNGIWKSIPEAWPAGTTFIFCFGAEQGQLTSRATIGSSPFLLGQDAAVGPLRTFSPEYGVGFR